MHFDVVLSVFIHPCTNKAEERSIQYSRGVDAAVCVRASDVCVRALQRCVRVLQMCACVCFRCVCASDVCVRVLQMCACAENFSHSARLLLQQSRASFMLASCLWAVLISSPDSWDWTRMHSLVVMHRRTLYENVESAKIKVPFYTTDIDILCMASPSMHHIDISIHIDEPLHL